MVGFGGIIIFGGGDGVVSLLEWPNERSLKSRAIAERKIGRKREKEKEEE